MTKPCKEWKGAKTKGGHGHFRKNGKHVYAHRNAYEEAYGSIPKGVMVCHKCDNRLCIEPDHLFLGSHQDNMDDMKKKGRAKKHAGSANPQSRLTNDDVIKIRELSSNTSQSEIAAMFKIAKNTVSMIINRKRWSHI